MSTTTELAVEMTCNNCVEKIQNILSKENEISDFSVDLSKQSVIVTSTLPSKIILDLIENQSGKRAVIMGQAGPAAAVAMLGGLIGSGSVQGVVRFIQVDNETCVIDGTLDGLTPGDHALAIHECGDISGGCSTVGDHFNPRNTRHGSPIDDLDDRHVGDLGNVKADESGRAQFKFSDKLVKVSDIIGRSVAIASDPDDYGKGGHPRSAINGNCGKLLSCGIIARSSGLFENSKRICACDGVTLWDERNKPLVGEGRRNKL